MANQVTLTFAGDSSQLERTFDSVGDSARRMDRDMGSAASGFDRANEAADTAEGRFQGFSSTLTGTADIAAGTGEIMKGNLFEGLVLVGGGAADLAEGFAYTLIPMTKSAVTAMRSLNLTMLANPIGIVIIAALALAAVFVILWKRSETFRRIVRGAWEGVKAAAINTWEWLRALPGRLGRALSSIGRIVSAPFRAAFNTVARAWNSTIGRLSWTVPGWIPGIGGNSISAPRLPTFHRGGTVPGPPGAEVLGVLQAGERVTPLGGGAPTVIEIRSGGGKFDDLLVEALIRGIRRRGPDPVAVLRAARG